MKKVTLIGIGMGNPDTLTQEGINALNASQVWIGASRMLQSVDGKGKITYNAYEQEKIYHYIASTSYESYAVLFSGDTGFYSGAAGVLEALKAGKEPEIPEEYEVKVVPGISTISYFSAALGIPWEDAHILSLHGRKCDYIRAVREHYKTFLLTDGKLSLIGKELIRAGLLSTEIYAGTSLSYPEEKIRKLTPLELSEMEDAPLTALFILNREYRKEYRLGIPDEEFIRGEVPMTKSEVRVISLSKLALKEGDILYDVGAGTGSLSVEAALLLEKGKVYAIEEMEEAALLIEKNREKFLLQNLHIIKGRAPECLKELPVPDAAFIGGSRGRLKEILEELLDKNPAITIVLNAVTLETLSEAIEAFRDLSFTDMEISQAAITRTRKAGRYHMLSAQNPVFIIKGKGGGKK